jgi:hypothetical protein
VYVVSPGKKICFPEYFYISFLTTVIFFPDNCCNLQPNGGGTLHVQHDDHVGVGKSGEHHGRRVP